MQEARKKRKVELKIIRDINFFVWLKENEFTNTFFTLILTVWECLFV